jgi:phosphotransferase system IIA component
MYGVLGDGVGFEPNLERFATPPARSVYMATSAHHASPSILFIQKINTITIKIINAQSQTLLRSSWQTLQGFVPL